VLLRVPWSRARIVFSRSESRGRGPDGVERHLKTPWRKSRGFGVIHSAASPAPFPSSPWQETQYRSKTTLPRTALPAGSSAQAAPARARIVERSHVVFMSPFL